MDGESRSGTPPETAWGEYAIFSLKDFFQLVWRRLWLIALTAVTLLGIVVGFNLVQTPTYEASAKILVGQELPRGAPSNLASDVQGLQQITRTVVEAVNSRPVAEDVVQELDLQVTPETLLENLNVEPVNETQFIQITYKDLDPEQAQEVANTVGIVSSDRISEVSPSANSITVSVWQPAVTPDAPVSPKILRNGMLALALGIILGVLLAFVLEHLDDRWRSPEELEQISGLPTFAVVPKFRVSKKIRRARKQQQETGEKQQQETTSKNERGYRVIRKKEGG